MHSHKKNTKVFTVIVTYNGMQWIEDCINSVINDTTVVVVDNQSSDGTLEFISQKFKDVIILAQNDNYGFGKSNNIGISYALNENAEYILLLNQDAKMEDGSVTKLIERVSNIEGYGIISPIHCNWNGDYLESSFSNYLTQNNNVDFYSDFVLSKQKKEIYEVPFVAAACWFINVNTLKQVGGFDPIFKHLGEDVNLAQRFNYHGFKIGVIPDSRVMHDTGGRTIEKVEKYSEKYFYKFDYRSKMKFADINIGNWQEKIKYAKNQTRKELLFALMRFNFSHFNGGLKQIKLLNKIKIECKKSRAITKDKGSHYLNY